MEDHGASGFGLIVQQPVREIPLTSREKTVLQDNEDEILAIEEAVEEEDAFDNSDSQVGTSFCNIEVRLPESTLITPRSIYDGFLPPAPLTRECVALESLLSFNKDQPNDDFTEFELEDFTIYINSEPYPCEMRGLHTYATKTGLTIFYFDGVLRIGDIRHFVRKIPFEEVPIGNYGTDHATVGDQVWIRSKYNTRKEIYYRLKKPAREYARFHNAFLWVADLAKHFIDFCEWMIEKGRNVSIYHFKQDFSKWLLNTHKKSPSFQRWYYQRGSDDFRQSIAANREFICKETYSLLGPQGRSLQIMREIVSFDHYRRQGPPPIDNIVRQTIVTPYIYDCFSHLELGQLLKVVEPTISTKAAIKLSWPEDPLKTQSFVKQSKKFATHNAMIESLKPGDTISTPPDGAQTGTKWRSGVSEGKMWYGLVQKVHILGDGSRSFDITWLYHPEDTPCCSMKYPWKKELFLSDHCTCNEGKNSKIHDNEILDTHTVEWFGSPDTTAEFFVRQTYMIEQRRFVTLEKTRLHCNHGQKKAAQFVSGDTVLSEVVSCTKPCLATTPGNSVVLEPFELVEHHADTATVRLRKLLRRSEVDPQGRHCAPNELVYTDDFVSLAESSVKSKCIIRLFAPDEQIPAPYNRNGTGNAFFITHRKLASQTSDGVAQFSPIMADPPPLRQGFDPKRRVQKLRALDLFSGCGNFGRGLEDGGAVEARWMNDIWSVAAHTYMANAKAPESITPFVGSIDDLLERGMTGKFSDSVPRPGDVDVVSGGSPCPGFSLITADKTTEKQKKNRSLVAAFAAFIDFYRPKYGILENVKTIVQRKKNRTEDFFSQLICALIGMGYQAQIIMGDAWSHGDPQTRVRAFLYFAAPGVRLPNPPELSHSHPRKAKEEGLGEMTNGEPYVRRSIGKATAFKFVSAAEATADLPEIGDAKPDTCIAFPDHRLSISLSSGDRRANTRNGETKNFRTQILNMPIRPYGINFSKAWNKGEGTMQSYERDAYPPTGHRVNEISKGWGRINPNGLFSTVTTACQPTDARLGTLMHWNEMRPLTIMEVRRAQGMPDDEVLLGTRSDQYAQVGNSVARQISMALGLSLREAFMGTLYDDDDVPVIEEKVEQPVVVISDNEDDQDDQDVTILPRLPQDDETSSKTSVLRISPESGPAEASSTPATSIADNDVAIIGSGSGATRKRPLSKSLAVGLISSKKPRLQYAVDLDRDVPLSIPSGATVVRIFDSDEDDESQTPGP